MSATVELACCFDRAYVLPTAVMATSVLAHASPLRHYVLHLVYDGSDDGKRVFDTLAVIGHRVEPGAGQNLEAPAKQAVLVALPRWPMTISYFKAGSGDLTPAYTISFELYENGISRALKLDYGDFALKGDLASLDVLPYGACER